MLKAIAASLGTLSLIAIVACREEEPTPTPSPTSSPTATQAPTPEPTVTQIPTAEPTATLLPPPEEFPPGEIAFSDGTLSTAEVNYLKTVNSGSDKVDEVLTAMEDPLAQTWPTRTRLLSVLREARIGTARRAFLHTLEEIEPPPRFKGEHDRYLQFLREPVPLTLQHDLYADEGNLVGIVQARADLLAARGVFLTEASSAFCEALTGPGAPPCRRSDAAQGGEYAAELSVLSRRFGAEFGPRVSGFVPALSEEEFFQSLLEVQPSVEGLIDNMAQGMQELDPSPEFRGDHERAIRYFEELLEVSRSITQAAMNKQRHKLLMELFPLSGQVLCDARRDLPPSSSLSS